MTPILRRRGRVLNLTRIVGSYCDARGYTSPEAFYVVDVANGDDRAVRIWLRSLFGIAASNPVVIAPWDLRTLVASALPGSAVYAYDDAWHVGHVHEAEAPARGAHADRGPNLR